MSTGLLYRLPSPISSVSIALSTIGRKRWSECALLTGFVLISLPFASPARDLHFGQVGLLLMATGALFSSVYSFNSYFGFQADRLNPRLSDQQLTTQAQYLGRGGFTLLFSLGLFFSVSLKLALLAAAVFVLWIGYSIPNGAKSRPFWGTAVHLFAQILQFHLGVLLVSQPSLRTLGVSVFFALLFSGGHLIHELKDRGADQAAGIRTSAVVFGSPVLVPVYRVLTVVGAVYWYALFTWAWVPFKLFAPLFAAAVAHSAISFIWSAEALEDRRKNQTFQTIYRLFYLAAGCLTLFGI